MNKKKKSFIRPIASNGNYLFLLVKYVTMFDNKVLTTIFIINIFVSFFPTLTKYFVCTSCSSNVAPHLITIPRIELNIATIVDAEKDKRSETNEDY